MAYVDGFLIPVATDRKDEYAAHERQWWSWFRDHGATGLMVCWGDDVPEGKLTDFRRAVALLANETVVFAWMTWPDKMTRDRAFQVMMDDPGMGSVEMPFDGKRMVFGGFAPLVEEGVSTIR